MGLLTILKKIKQKEKELRILILGLDNAGKTTVMKKISGENIHEISPTVGFNIKSLEYKGTLIYILFLRYMTTNRLFSYAIMNIYMKIS